MTHSRADERGEKSRRRPEFHCFVRSSSWFFTGQERPITNLATEGGGMRRLAAVSQMIGQSIGKPPAGGAARWAPIPRGPPDVQELARRAPRGAVLASGLAFALAPPLERLNEGALNSLWMISGCALRTAPPQLHRDQAGRRRTGPRPCLLTSASPASRRRQRS
jgi:hypothetical protein